MFKTGGQQMSINHHKFFEKNERNFNRLKQITELSVRSFFQLAAEISEHPNCSDDIKKIITTHAVDLAKSVNAITSNRHKRRTTNEQR